MLDQLRRTKLENRMTILLGCQFELTSEGVAVAALDFNKEQEFVSGGWIVE